MGSFAAWDLGAGKPGAYLDPCAGEEQDGKAVASGWPCWDCSAEAGNHGLVRHVVESRGSCLCCSYRCARTGTIPGADAEPVEANWVVVEAYCWDEAVMGLEIWFIYPLCHGKEQKNQLTLASLLSPPWPPNTKLGRVGRLSGLGPPEMGVGIG